MSKEIDPYYLDRTNYPVKPSVHNNESKDVSVVASSDQIKKAMDNKMFTYFVLRQLEDSLKLYDCVDIDHHNKVLEFHKEISQVYNISPLLAGLSSIGHLLLARRFPVLYFNTSYFVALPAGFITFYSFFNYIHHKRIESNYMRSRDYIDIERVKSVLHSRAVNLTNHLKFDINEAI